MPVERINIKEPINFPSDELVSFLDRNEYLLSNNELLAGSPRLSVANMPFRQDNHEYKFVDEPVNIDAAFLLLDPLYINKYFESRGFSILDTMPVVRNDSTTLFTSAGIQIFESVIFDEDTAESELVFINQPVLRTQYMDGIREGNALSFINISTGALGITMTEHYRILQIWLDFLIMLGLDKEKIYFKVKQAERKWGDKVMRGEMIFIVYDGLEIGDAYYIPSVDQNTRDNFSVSDIGFGLERIAWILKGGSFFDTFTGYKVPRDVNSLDNRVMACLHAMIILVLEGLSPSNKSHGYRLRLFSKTIIRYVKGDMSSVERVLEPIISRWSKWTNNPARDTNDVINIIMQENYRNFNRLLLDYLSQVSGKKTSGFNINLSTTELIMRLRNSHISSDIINNALKELRYGE